MERGIIGMALEPTDLFTSIEVAEAAGYDVIEFRVDMVEPFLAQGHTVDELVAKFDSVAVRPHVLSAIENIDLPDGSERDGMIAQFQSMCSIAQAVGCTNIQVVAGDSYAGADQSTIVKETARGLREIADIAANWGMTVVFEPLAWMPICALEAAVSVIEQAQRPNVGLLVDTFMIFAGGGELETLRGLDPSMIPTVHLADTAPRKLEVWRNEDRYTMPGDGIVPLRSLLRAVLDTGYDGVITDEIWSGRHTSWSRLRIAQELKAKGDAIIASL